VFAWNDFAGMATIRTAHEAALTVPHDLSVVGYDDFDVAALTLPSLTTVREPLYETGAVGAEVLLTVLSGVAGGAGASGSQGPMRPRPRVNQYKSGFLMPSTQAALTKRWSGTPASSSNPSHAYGSRSSFRRCLVDYRRRRPCSRRSPPVHRLMRLTSRPSRCR